MEKETMTVDDAFKLPDLLTPEDRKKRQVELQRKQELFKPLDQPKIKLKVYAQGQFDRHKIKLGAAIQLKQQK